MKKILFAAYSLDLGGIETALVTLINYLAKKQYDITLVLEKKEGIFLDTMDKNIKIITDLTKNIKNFINRNTIMNKIIFHFFIGNKVPVYILGFKLPKFM